MELNSKADQGRQFCIHDMVHVVDVARTMYILSMENGLDYPKELIYATGFVHDVGRWKEAETGENHASIGAELCKDILFESGFSFEEVKEISIAVSLHRTKGQEMNTLGWLLYEADKKSRLCLFCTEVTACDRFCEGKKPEFFM